MSLLQTLTRFTQSFIEQRQSLREHVHFPAWLDAGGGKPCSECTVLDVSDGGARIMVPLSVTLPREFWLVFSKDGSRRRHCRTVWRSNNQIGVSGLCAPMVRCQH